MAQSAASAGEVKANTAGRPQSYYLLECLAGTVDVFSVAKVTI